MTEKVDHTWHWVLKVTSRQNENKNTVWEYSRVWRTLFTNPMNTDGLRMPWQERCHSLNHQHPVGTRVPVPLLHFPSGSLPVAWKSSQNGLKPWDTPGTCKGEPEASSSCLRFSPAHCKHLGSDSANGRSYSHSLCKSDFSIKINESWKKRWIWHNWWCPCFHTLEFKIIALLLWFLVYTYWFTCVKHLRDKNLKWNIEIKAYSRNSTKSFPNWSACFFPDFENFTSTPLPHLWHSLSPLNPLQQLYKGCQTPALGVTRQHCGRNRMTPPRAVWLLCAYICSQSD